MPHQGKGRVHRFRDHVVSGVNWRPTRFVDEVPNSRVCGLCHTIPKQTVLLPCSHALCQSCHAASLEGGVGQCPLDQVQFEEAECVGYEFPARIANALKVYCWNEEHGCEYTGTLDRMLEHYEKECTFHTVECLRCGEGVQLRYLPTHYVTGCSAGVSSVVTECPSSGLRAVTLEDVNAALEELKARLGDVSYDQLLPVIQGQLQDLTEKIGSQEATLAEITRELGACERNLKGEIAGIGATITSTASHQFTFQQNRAEEASASSSSLRSEMAMVLRKLEHFTNLSLSALEHLRHTSL
nr:E3 ubiquitin-protein ligase PDZRN3-like [Dermacentor andersoni]